MPSTDPPSGSLCFFTFPLQTASDMNSSQRKRLSGRWLNSYERYR
ncbi:FUSC family protein, partial [Neisseria gonorrhoeae]